MQALYPGDTNAAGASRMIAAALGIPVASIAIKSIADRVWEREWLKDFHAMRFGKRLWVAPHHETVTEPDAIVVRLDPGLAFGTGTHPTTALCLQWLDRHITPGVRVIDYGCGSGILAVAAVKLGASHAYCFDIDPQALIATRDNAAVNGVTERVTVCESVEHLSEGADILVANILSGPLCALAPSFARLVGSAGTLVLAGLMEWQVPEVTQAHDAWFHMRPFAKRDDWVGLSGRRRF
jgi:ribosomal protein L11 methyltransferase